MCCNIGTKNVTDAINYLSGKEAIYIINSRDEIIPFITSSAARSHYSGTGIIQLYVNNEGPFNIIADISADALADDKLRGPLRGTLVLSLYKASSSTYLIISNPIVCQLPPPDKSGRGLSNRL